MAHPLDEQVEAIVRLVQPTAQTDASRSEVFQYVCRLIEASQLGAKVRTRLALLPTRRKRNRQIQLVPLSHHLTHPRMHYATHPTVFESHRPGVLVWIGSAQDVFARRRY